VVQFSSFKSLVNPIQIYDPKNARFEVPIPTPPPGPKVNVTDYDISFRQVPFGLKVTRKSTNTVL
jgi:hypothetical protein